MSNRILFVFEGEKTEDQITKSLTQFFVNEDIVVTCAYCSTIYKLYRQIADDEYLDTFTLLKEIPRNLNLLKDFTRDDFAEIYMFFDYDGHDDIADDEKLKQVFSFFTEETDKGKIYLSYPMVESIKHICDFTTFRDLKVPCKVNVRYKELVGNSCLNELKDFRKYGSEIWRRVTIAHLSKMNHIVRNVYDFPSELIDQSTIFENQLEKYITVDSCVAVLSSFPIFLHDYYGNAQLSERLKTNI